MSEYRLENGTYAQVSHSEPLQRGRGLRRRDGTLQLGLTEREIGGIMSRIERLLRRVDRGRLDTF